MKISKSDILTGVYQTLHFPHPQTRSQSGRRNHKRENYAHDMYYQDSDFEIEDRAVALAKKKAVTPAQIGIAWILNKPSAVAPIFGDKKMHHLEQASDSLTVKLSDEDMHHLEERYQPHKILGHT